MNFTQILPSTSHGVTLPSSPSRFSSHSKTDEVSWRGETFSYTSLDATASRLHATIDCLKLEQEADQEAQLSTNDFKEAWEIRNHFYKVIEKYQEAAEAALLIGDGAKAIELYQKAARVAREKLKLDGIEELEEAIATLREKGREDLCPPLYQIILSYLNEEISQLQISGGDLAPGYWIKKVDLLERLGIEKTLCENLYKQAADYFQGADGSQERSMSTLLIAAILYQKAAIPESEIVSKYRGVIESSAPILSLIESEIETLFALLENEKQNPSKIVFSLLCAISLGYPVMARELQFSALQVGEKELWAQSLQKEFDYFNRFLNLAPERGDLGLDRLKSTDSLSIYVLSTYFAIGNELLAHYDSSDSANWEKLNLQMTQIKEWVQRGAPEIFINKLKEAIGKEQSRLQRLFFEPPTDRTFEETVSLFSHEGRI